MAKTHIIITVLLAAVVVILLYIASQPQTITSQPNPAPVIITPLPETPTPRATPIERGTPTPRAPETPTPPSGVAFEKIFPTEVTFYVNDIFVPPTSTYEGGNYIPLKKSAIKTFAGSFGPYFDDPTPNLRVVLCEELRDIPAAPACDTASLLYRDNYVHFARGYQFDEYIGAMAAKDYTAYYTVSVGNTTVANSNRAYIRTVSD